MLVSGRVAISYHDRVVVRKSWYMLPSLKLTAFLPLKIRRAPNGNWHLVFQPSIFRCYVSIREGKCSNKTSPKRGIAIAKTLKKGYNKMAKSWVLNGQVLGPQHLMMFLVCFPKGFYSPRCRIQVPSNGLTRQFHTKFQVFNPLSQMEDTTPKTSN